MKLSLLTAVLALAAVCTTVEHTVAQDEDLIVKRYKQVLHAYMGRLKAKTVLAEAVETTASELKLDEEKKAKLVGQVPATISKFVQEAAEKWRTNDERRSSESKSLSQSTLVVEQSDAWQVMLKTELNAQQLAAWQVEANKRNEAALQAQAHQKAEAERAAVAREQALQRQAMARAEALAAVPDRLDGISDAKAVLTRACQGVIGISKTTATAELQREVNWLTTAVKLSPKQTRRLEIAIKGVMKKRFDGDLARVEVLKEEVEDADEESRQRKELHGIYVRHSASQPVTTDAFWLRTVKSTLTDDQFAQFEVEQSARVEFQRKTRIGMVIMKLDEAARLSISQRKQLSTLFRRSGGNLEFWQKSTAYRLYSSLNDELRQGVNAVLSGSQIKQVQNADFRMRKVRGTVEFFR